MPSTETTPRPRTDGPHLRRRPGSPRRSFTVVMLVVCVALAGLLSSCGQEGEIGAAPLSERAENDVPLNPPTLRFHVSEDGEVDASPDRTAEAGEVVAIVLENESDSSYELRLVDPDGNDVFTVEAPAGGRGDGRVAPRDPGTHEVEIHPTGEPQAAEAFDVEVSTT